MSSWLRLWRAAIFGRGNRGLTMMFILAGGLAAVGCAEERVEEVAVVRPVKILTVGESRTGTLEYPGEVSAAQHADMAFEVSGKIVRFPVDEGQAVRKGAFLAGLDPSRNRLIKDGADLIRLIFDQSIFVSNRRVWHPFFCENTT